MKIIAATVTQLAAAIQADQISAAEVMVAHLSQIDRLNPALNAIVTMDVEQARDRPRAADEALAHDEIWGPLHGVPFTLKDSHFTAGMRTTVGHPPLANYMPEEDSTVAARLKAAGGILLGKTNVPEFLGDAQTNNPVFGRTNNPWDLDRTPGGSSGGAAAAVAAGLTPFDIGSDYAGSIRNPAHFCGIYGLKPTEGRVPATGHWPPMPGSPRPIRRMASIGPMARSVEDLALLYSIIAGPDGRDTETPPVPVEPVPEVALADLRLAVAPTVPGLPVSTEIRGAVRNLATQLDPLCEAVEEALPDLAFGEEIARFGELTGMPAGLSHIAERERANTVAHYRELLHRRDQSIGAWERFFDRWDVLLCPVSMVTAFPHCNEGTPLLVDDKKTSYWLVEAHCKLFNYTGHPVVVLPVTRDRHGLPIGVQVIGRRWSESRLLAIAETVSQLVGGFRGPPQKTTGPDGQQSGASSGLSEVDRQLGAG